MGAVVTLSGAAGGGGLAGDWAAGGGMARSAMMAAREALTVFEMVSWRTVICSAVKADMAGAEPYCAGLASSNLEAVSCRPGRGCGACAIRAAFSRPVLASVEGADPEERLDDERESEAEEREVRGED